MKSLWLIPPSKYEDKVPLVSQNRWAEYLPKGVNNIYPVIVAYGVSMISREYDIDFLDAPTKNMKLKDVLNIIPKYDLVIIECRTFILNWVMNCARLFKFISPKTLIAVYGDHTMVRPEDVAKDIDYIVQCGDYDYGVYKLVKSLEADQKPPRIFKCELLPNFESLPHLDRDKVPWRDYFESWRHREAFGWTQFSRGCWAHCIFCSWVKTFYNYKYRSMTPQAAYDEIMYAHEKYGIDEFLDDSDTFVPKPFGLQFSNLLKEKDLDIFWNIQTRADVMASCSVEELKQLKDSGLHIVKLGVDAGNNYTLDRIKKGYDIETVRKAVEKLKQASLEVHINMILGWPWDDLKTSYDIIRFVRGLKPNQAQFSLIQPYVGTELWDEAYREKWFINDPFNWDSYDMQHPILRGKMKPEEIARLHRDAWRSFYLNRGFILHNLEKSCVECIRNGNFDSLRHNIRGFKSVYYGHMRAVS